MKMLVCIKQVPEIDSLDLETPDDSGPFRMNRFDETALEEALQIRETVGDAQVEVITVGSRSAADVLKRAVGMGADRGIHLLGNDRRLEDPYYTASRIARFAGQENYDLILTGVMSEDLMQGQVGPMIAALLNWPHATAVVSLDLFPDNGKAEVERETEGGAREVLRVSMPALFSLQTGINRPRYPALSHLLRASRTPPDTRLDDIAIAPRQAVFETTLPEKKREGRVLVGSTEEKALELVRQLSAKGFLRGNAG